MEIQSDSVPAETQNDHPVVVPAATKFTPGPWHTCRDGECSCAMVSCDDFPVATVTRGSWGDEFPAVRLVGDGPITFKAEAYMEKYEYGAVPHDEARANAVLIAAAPDMYAALVAHDEYMTANYCDGPTSLALHPRAAENWKLVRAAIELANPARPNVDRTSEDTNSEVA